MALITVSILKNEIEQVRRREGRGGESGGEKENKKENNRTDLSTLHFTNYLTSYFRKLVS